VCAAPTRPRQWRGTLPRHRGGRIEHTPAGWLIGDEEVFLMIFINELFFKFYLQIKIYLIDNDTRLTKTGRFVRLSKLLLFALIIIFF